MVGKAVFKNRIQKKTKENKENKSYIPTLFFGLSAQAAATTTSNLGTQSQEQENLNKLKYKKKKNTLNSATRTHSAQPAHSSLLTPVKQLKNMENAGKEWRENCIAQNEKQDIGRISRGNETVTYVPSN